jgi:D-glycero-D-manno-heptose 1,7-bisphosphate phosphatase
MKLIILDRDGVINKDSDAFVKTADEWIPIDGSIEAIAQLYQAGFTVVVATNQSGLGRGLFDLDQLEAMHAKMNELVLAAGGEISGVFYCPHTPDDDCQCRKPKSGLIDAIESELGISANKAFCIGDSLRDLEAGIAKGCTPILVKTGKGEKMLAQMQADRHIILEDLLVFDNLAEAANSIIAQQPQNQ